MQDRRLKLSDGKIAAIPNDWNDDQIADFITTYEQQSTPQPVTSSPRRPADQESLSTKMSAGADLAAKNLPGGKFVRNLIRRENWPMLAGGAAGLATGGLGAVPAIGAAALGGMTGKAAQMMTDGAEGKEPESVGAMVRDIGIEGGKQGAIEGMGRGIVAGGRAVARGTMRRALGAPKGAMEKYTTAQGKDLIDEALDRGVRVTKGGFQKVHTARTGAQDAKAALVEQMHDRVSILTNPIKRQAAEKTLPDAVGQRLAGLRDTMDPTPAVSAFGGGRPGLKPGELELAKKALDADTAAAHQAVRMGRKPALDDMERMALAQGANDSMEVVAPGYRAKNQEIRQLMGLENAIRGRLAQPATGLADDITAGVISAGGSTPEALAMRALRGPAALSNIAALVAQLAKGGKVAPAAVRSLLVSSHER
jgi:hypothetical protein